MKIVNLAHRALWTILYSLATITPLHASEVGATTPIEDARAILIANNVEQTMDTLFSKLVPVMESGFIGQLTQTDGGDKLIQEIDSAYPGGTKAFGKRFGELMMTGLRQKYPDIIENAAQQYVMEISPSDLVVIRAFMESSTGRSLAAAQPKIQQQMSAAGQTVGRKVGEEAAVQLMAEAGKYFGTRK
jgi:hypothetical protein